MKKLLMILPFVAFTAACETDADRATVAGAATGAVLGAAVADDDKRLEGALIGTAAGAVAGSLIGKANSPGDCIYRDQNGNRYIAPCP